MRDVVHEMFCVFCKAEIPTGTSHNTGHDGPPGRGWGGQYSVGCNLQSQH